VSFAKGFKKRLIAGEVVEMCVGILRSNKHENNSTIIENTAAILLNMLECPEALPKFDKEKDIFEIFKKYINSKFKIARALIYGIIYALLESP
jgi:hypothetical protein